MINSKGIYIIKNKENGKCYIGKTEESFKRRWWHHKGCLNGGYHSNKYLQHSWNKYGEESFSFEVLVTYEEGLDLNELEIKLIKEYNSFEKGYNLTIGGEGTTGHKMTEEAKRVIGIKNRENMTGKKLSEETKKKMSESHKGKIKTEEHRKNLSKSLKGKEVKQETKDKLRNANIGSKQANSKYTEELIYEVKVDLKNGYTPKMINEKYGIPTSYVYHIRDNRRWTHVIID